MFTADDYQTLHSIVFATDADGRPRYPGYRPEVVELPNGDGRADREKRYAHVSYKNLYKSPSVPLYSGLTPAEWCYLLDTLRFAHAEALRVARALGAPEAFMPDIRYSALRVLEYPPGATSARHTDFDLFTLLCYRDRPEGLVRHPRHDQDEPGLDPDSLDAIAPGLHIGELGEIVGLGPATPHEVVPVYETARVYGMPEGGRPGPLLKTVPGAPAPQHSIVYFAIPDHAAVLRQKVATVNPVTGERGDVEWPVTVGEWIDEHIGKRRAPR